MPDRQIKGKQTTAEQKESATKQETTETTIPSEASSLAGMFLVHQMQKGREIEIPSLGIKIGQSKSQSSSSKELDSTKEKEVSPKNTNTSS